MRNIFAKQLRKEVVNNIEHCENFDNVFEMIFESNYKKFSEFKEKHHREGEFTDENGVLALATGYYLGGYSQDQTQSYNHTLNIMQTSQSSSTYF